MVIRENGYADDADKADERGLRFTLQYASDFSSADDADNTDFFLSSVWDTLHST